MYVAIRTWIQKKKEDMRNGRVAAIVHLSVLGWSATILPQVI